MYVTAVDICKYDLVQAERYKTRKPNNQIYGLPDLCQVKRKS